MLYVIADLQDSQHRQPELSDNGGDKFGGMEENEEEGAVGGGEEGAVGGKEEGAVGGKEEKKPSRKELKKMKKKVRRIV